MNETSQRLSPIAVQSFPLETPPKKKNVWAQVGRYSSLAFLLPTAVFIGYGIGYYLDKALGTHFLYIVFLLIGIAAGFVELFREVRKDLGD
ncbi:MAG: AtpZ/AtpI family protein [Acidobacteriia bacterium]|nr:AtpZ/AtpI family protein [Terriglobia bacterium]